MKNRYTVAIPYDEPAYGARTYTARIEVSAASEAQAKALALEEFRKLEALSGVRWAREVHDGGIVIESVESTGRPALRLRTEIRGGVALVLAEGMVDEGTFVRLDEELRMLMDNGNPKVVIDCSGLEYISSSGIGTVLEASARGSVKLCRVPENIRHVLSLVGLDRILDLFDSAEDAVSSFE